MTPQQKILLSKRFDELGDSLFALIDDMIAAEREECAKVAMKYREQAYDTGNVCEYVAAEEIATAIRARK